MIISQTDSVCLVIDVQEKLIPVIKDFQQIIDMNQKLIKGMRILGVPIICTEQYPQGLGDTYQDIREILGPNQRYIPKKDFGVYRVVDVKNLLDASQKKQVIIAGVESHICVLQSVIQLQSSGYQCVVVMDACGSRKDLDHQVAFQRMLTCGAVVTTMESLLFEMLQSADRQEFKQISQLIKEGS